MEALHPPYSSTMAVIYGPTQYTVKITNVSTALEDIKSLLEISGDIDVTYDGGFVEDTETLSLLLSRKDPPIFTISSRHIGRTAIFWDVSSLPMSPYHNALTTLNTISKMLPSATFYVFYDSTNPSHWRMIEMDDFHNVIMIDQSSWVNRFDTAIAKMIRNTLLCGRIPRHILIMSGKLSFFSYIKGVICAGAKSFYLIHPKSLPTYVSEVYDWEWKGAMEDIFEGVEGDYKSPISTPKSKSKIESDLNVHVKEFIPSPKRVESWMEGTDTKEI